MKTNKVLPKLPAFETLVVSKDAIWDMTTSVVRDMMNDNAWVEAKALMTECIDSLRYPACMLSWFRSGGTVFILGEQMERVEKMAKEKKPFIVVIMDNTGLVYATVNSTDVRF